MFHLRARITVCTALAAGGLLLAACSPTERQTSQSTDSQAPSVETPAAPEASTTAPGMKAYRDPKTGEMRDPTDAERAAMAGQSNDNKAAPTEPQSREEKLRNGGTAIMLEPDAGTPLQACRAADGSMVVDHNCKQAPSTPDSKGDNH